MKNRELRIVKLIKMKYAKLYKNIRFNKKTSRY